MSADELAYRNEFVSVFDQGWTGYTGQSFASDQVAVSSSDLRSKVGAIVPQPGEWYRIRLAAGDWSAAGRDECDLRGTGANVGGVNAGGGARDFSRGGGGLLIEPDTTSPIITSRIRALGLRGVQFRNLIFARDASMNSGGINVDTWVPADGPSPRDEYMFIVDYNGTCPEFPIVRLDGCSLGARFNGITDESRYEGSIVIKGAEQVDIIDTRFFGYETAISVSGCRRLRRHRCDFQHGLADCLIIGAPAAMFSAFSAVFPDAQLYRWNRLNTIRNITDNNLKTNTAGGDIRLYDIHMDNSQTGASGDWGFNLLIYNTLDEFETAEMQRVTYKDIVKDGKKTRPSGGPQFIYNDDMGCGMRAVVFNCGGASGSGITFFNGWARAKNCTIVLAGNRPPSATVENDGFVGSYDSEAICYTRRRSDYTAGSDHRLSKCVYGVISDGGGTATSPPETVTLVDNVVVNWKSTADEAKKPNQLMNGTFGRDAENRVTYAKLSDGSETQAQFRQRFYDQFRLKDGNAAGITNPAGWPVI